jgi:hypothetical protein
MIGITKRRINKMKWTQKEKDVLLSLAIASDDENKSEMFDYIHYMMYDEGLYEFKVKRTVLSVKNMYYKLFKKDIKKKKIIMVMIL